MDNDCFITSDIFEAMTDSNSPSMMDVPTYAVKHTLNTNVIEVEYNGRKFMVNVSEVKN